MDNDKEMSEEDNKVAHETLENELSGDQLKTENDPHLEEEQQEEEEDSHVDLTNFSKKQLLGEMKELVKKDNLIELDSYVNELKNNFDEYYNKEKGEALEQFIKEGGSEDDFQYRKSEEDKEFFSLFGEFKDRKSARIKELEKSKEQNAIAKNRILDKLRELVDGEETTHSINTIKQIQDEWKKIGPVPSNQNRNLWASYNALMDRFYDNRSIYFELKELDRKKNLESKLELCQKAETLIEVEDLKEAIRQLNDLHEEFKHIGPVTREEQENVWQRFKKASDAVYSRRKEYYEDQKEVFKENQVIKEGLIEKLEAFKDFKAERIRDWNIKTKEILAIQKEWESIGPVPRESGKEINKKFWGLFKHFFHNKNQFFKELDEIRLVNKEKAENLIAEAEAELSNTDVQQAANKLIKLQQDWKSIGPTPEKVRDELYKRFKTACDTFFENRRKSNKEQNKEFDKNLDQKEKICAEIVQEADGENLSVEKLEEWIVRFDKIGFVPRKNIKEISGKFKEAVEYYVSKLGIEGENLEDFLFRLNLNKIQSDPNANRTLNKKEHGIRKQITDLENNITLWKNNLEFFTSSRTADKLKDQFDEKIEKAEQEVDRLKKKLSIIREF